LAKQWVEHGQKRRLGDLKPHPKNSRKHPQEQITALVAAMGEWDWTRPLLIDDKGVILAGHGAVQAGMVKFGADFEAPVSVAHGWTESKKRAYIIADNQLTELSQWDQPMLQAELKELSANPGYLQPMGFTQLRVAEILEPKPQAQGSRTPSPVIQTNIVFDTADQQQTWFSFIRKLKAQYPDQATVAGKLNEFLKEQLGNG
jgi:hypothetical protein